MCLCDCDARLALTFPTTVRYEANLGMKPTQTLHRPQSRIVVSSLCGSWGRTLLLEWPETPTVLLRPASTPDPAMVQALALISVLAFNLTWTSASDPTVDIDADAPKDINPHPFQALREFVC